MLIQRIFPDIIWRDRTVDSKKIYLTFDDGPDPVSTPVLIDILENCNVAATHFLQGERVKKFAELTDFLRSQNQLIANHGFYHKDGWKMSPQAKMNNILEGRKLTRSQYYRPPFGRISLRQFRRIKSSNKVVFWSLMPWDFNPRIDAKTCFKNIVENVRGGDIIVLHDKPELISKMSYYLPKSIEAIFDKGLSFGRIDEIED